MTQKARESSKMRQLEKEPASKGDLNQALTRQQAEGKYDMQQLKDQLRATNEKINHFEKTVESVKEKTISFICSVVKSIGLHFPEKKLDQFLMQAIMTANLIYGFKIDPISFTDLWSNSHNVFATPSS